MSERPYPAVLGIAVLWLSACGDAAAPENPVALSVSPEAILLSDSVPEQTLYLTTTPSGGTLEWQIADKPDWLDVTPSSGRIQRSIAEARISAPGLASADAGQYGGILSLISDGGAAAVNVTVQLAANPTATVSPGELVIAESDDSATLTLRNDGRGTLRWTAASSSPSLGLSASHGWLSFGDSVKLHVIADKGPLAAGEHDETVTVSGGVTGDVVVPVKIVVPAAPVAAVSLSRLVFTSGVDTLAFMLHNSGKGDLTWSASAGEAWLTMTPGSGDVAVGDSVEITAVVDRTGIDGEEAASSMTIVSNSTRGDISISAVVTASTGLGEGVEVLDHRVIDAEYNAASGLVVTVSANPSRLNIIDVVLGTVSSVPLELPPSTVSVRPDGAFAAVGHDGLISYVDLRATRLSETYSVTTDVFDIVLPDDGWVYAFPRVDQWVAIHSVDLGTGAELTNSGTIRAGTVAKLHPSSDFVYGADRGLSPSDFEKYDIRQGAAKVMYDSPYHGDYSFAGDIWISEDGGRLFARSGNVFRSSPVRSEDMLYAGSLSGMTWVKSLSDAQRLGRIVALAASDWGGTLTSEIRIYDQEYMEFHGVVALPGFPADTTTVESLGHFIFASRDGENVYVLVQASPEAGLAQDWGIVKVPASTLP